MALNYSPVRSDVISRKGVSELSSRVGYPAHVAENCLTGESPIRLV